MWDPLVDFFACLGWVLALVVFKLCWMFVRERCISSCVDLWTLSQVALNTVLSHLDAPRGSRNSTTEVLVLSTTTEAPPQRDETPGLIVEGVVVDDSRVAL